MHRWLAVSTLLVFGGLEIPAHPFPLCSPSTPREQIERAAFVFTGVVDDDGRQWATPILCGVLKLFRRDAERCHYVEPKVRATRVWKGDVPRQLTVAAPLDPLDGAIAFRGGDEYLFLVAQTLDGPFTSICSGTAPLAASSGTLQLLGPPRGPEAIAVE